MNRFSLLAYRRKGPKAPGRRSTLRSCLASLAVLAVAFGFGLYLFFPAGALKQRIEREVAVRTPAELHLGSLALNFPPGLQARNASLKLPPPVGRTFEFATASARPLWTSLIGTNPGVSFRAAIEGGKVEGTLRRNGAAEAELVGIRFSVPLMEGSPLAFAGVLEKGSFTGTLPLQAATESRLRMTAGEARLSGLEGLGLGSGELPLGTIRLEGAGRGNSFRIERLEAGGGSLAVTGEGTLLLAASPAASRVNLNLVLRPAPGLDRALLDLLDVFAKPSGEGAYRLQLSGTLAAPTLR